MRLLIADDDLISLKMLQRVLAVHDYQIETATDGNEAWRILQGDDAPRLALLDWAMPGMDGVEICRQLRGQTTLAATFTPVYAILLTGRASKSDVVAGLEAGANDFMTKPFDLGELCARVNAGRTMVELHARLTNRLNELRRAQRDGPRQ